MKEPVDRTHGLQIPSSMFMAFSSVSALLFIPLLYSYVVPKLTVSNLPYNINNLRRIGLGMIVAIFSLVAALAVEICRHQMSEYQVHDKLSGDNLTVSDMSIFYQIPQYVLSGLAEVLVFVSGKAKLNQ